MPGRVAELKRVHLKSGMNENEAAEQAEAEVQAWMKEQEARFNQRYERELMNPREALSLGSISRIVMPTELRGALGKWVDLFMRRYEPSPMTGVQREFF
jgi:acetyl-CoA carboxylase carboxyltransferase component